MPSLILKGDSASCHDFFALGALSSKFFLKTTNTVHIGFVRDNERLGSNLGFAHHTLKAFIVPLSRLVLHLFHPWSESVTTGIAPASKFCIIAACTKYEGVLSCKWLLH